MVPDVELQLPIRGKKETVKLSKRIYLSACYLGDSLHNDN